MRFDILLEHGGFAAYAIMFAGLILIIIGVERIITLFFLLSYNTTASLSTLKNYIYQKRYTEALQVCNSQQNAPEIQVIKDGLLSVESGREAMKSALGSGLVVVSQKCEARLSYLGLIANVSTLLGLLGTISGLIKTFAAIANADPSTKGKLLGIGISEAMYATMAGLMVGILAMVLHAVCLAKADHIISDAQEAALNLVKWIEQSERTDHVR